MRASVLKRLMEIEDERLRGVLIDVVAEMEKEWTTREMLESFVQRTDENFKRVWEAIHELAEAQKRTEKRVEELAEAQKRTENRLEQLAEAQRRTEERVGRLEETVAQLAEAQKRTENRVEQLAEAQKRTEERVNRLEEAVAQLAEAQKRTEERLNRLEDTVAQLAEAQRRTEEELRQLAGQVRSLTDELRELKNAFWGEKGRLEGERYEWRMIQSARRLLGRGRGGSPRIYEVQRMLDEMIHVLEASDWEDDPYNADLIWDKGQVVLVVEISVVVDRNDVMRAWKRAQTLRRAGVDALPVVMGERWVAEDTRRFAEEKGVAWYVELAFSPDLVEIRKAG